MTLSPLRIVLALTVLGVAAVLGGCGGDAETDAARSAPVAVVTTVLAPRAWQDSLEALGTTAANESVVVTATVSETVRRVNFESGDYVEAGTPLVGLSGNAQLAGLEEARAAYREANQLYLRQAELGKRQLVSASQIDTQRAIRDAALARVNAVSAALGDRAITAPFDGVLGLRRVSPGTLVTPGTPIVTLDDVSVIKLDFSVPEMYLAVLAPGQTITARSAAFPERSFDGHVSAIDTRVDPVTRAVTVRAQIPNPDRLLRPGMLLRVRLFQPARQALVLPEIAVVQIGLDSYVFRVAADGSVAQTKIALGARQRGVVEILGGVQAGERVVTEGTVKLRNGMRVVEAAPVPATATEPAATKPAAESAATAPPARA